MKKTLTFTAIAMIGVASLFSSCSKSSSGSSNSIKATIGSTAFSSSNCYFGITAGSLSIASYNATAAATYPYVVLSVSNYTTGATGTYNISDTANIAGVDSSASNVIFAQSGTLTITSASASQIVGTFSFTCTDGTKVTGGTFTAKVD